MYEVIGLICLSIIIHIAEPILLIKRFLGFKEEDYHKKSAFLRFIHRGLYCLVCSSFWFTLIITGNFYTASIVAISASILNYYIKDKL